MKQILFFIFSLIVLAGAHNPASRLLFCLKQDQPALQFQNSKVSGLSSGMQKILKEYPEAVLQRWLKSADASDVYGEVDFSRIYRLRFSYTLKKTELANLLKRFAALPEVLSSQVEQPVAVAAAVAPFTPNDLFYKHQWYIHRIQADYAWGLWPDGLPGNSTVLVGVVDTGVDYLHPDLSAALYINPGEDLDGDGRFTEADINGVDDDGNGFVDDLRGWDFVGATDTSSGDNDIRPPFVGSSKILSHGTHVSGIMAATGQNEIGIAGVSFRSKIIATKQSHDEDVDNAWLWDAYDGILYCAKMGAVVINCSWGGSGYGSYEQDLIDHVTNDYGAIVVAAAGNDNTNNDRHHFYPSDFENTVAVAALEGNDRKASFSNYGRVIDISAPGTSIFSTIHANAGSYASWQGTSMASPVVAGALALIKAWFPEQEREALLTTLYQGADDLDGVNPGYTGLLGAGCVNVYNSIAKRIYPNCSVSGLTIQTPDEKSNELSPGISAGLHFTIQNKAFWRNATGLRLILQSENPYVEILDSIYTISELEAGDSQFVAGDSLCFRVLPDAPYQPVEFQIRMTANSDSLYPYADKQVFSFNVQTNHKGYPLNNISVSQPLTVERFNEDSTLVVLFVGTDNKLYCTDEQGNERPGFPVNIGSYVSMAPVIATRNGVKEIALCTRNGHFKRFDSGGNQLSDFDLSETVYGGMSATDMNGDGNTDYILGTLSKQLHVLVSDSSELPGFPVTVSSFIDKGVAVADLSGDGIPEMVFTTYDNYLHRIDTFGAEANGWPVKPVAKALYTPVILSGLNSHLVLLLESDGTIQMIQANGKEYWKRTFQSLPSAPAVPVDLTADGVPELVIPFEDATIRVLTLEGDEVSSIFPFTLSAVVREPVALATTPSESHPYFICTTEAGTVHILDINGQEAGHFPLIAEYGFSAAPVVADLDNDGNGELVCGGLEGLQVYDLKLAVPNQGWVSYMGNNQRTGTFKTNAVLGMASKDAQTVNTFKLYPNYPNPFNNSTVISFRLPESIGNTSVRLIVYDINGREIQTLVKQPMHGGMHSVIWDGLTRNGLPAGSGIYFYRLSAGRVQLYEKAMLIK